MEVTDNGPVVLLVVLLDGRWAATCRPCHGPFCRRVGVAGLQGPGICAWGVQLLAIGRLC